MLGINVILIKHSSSGKINTEVHWEKKWSRRYFRHLIVCVCVCVYIYIYIYIYMCVCVCVCVCVYVYERTKNGGTAFFMKDAYCIV